MSEVASILTDITTCFDAPEPPGLFRQLAANAGLLAATWRHYQSVMFGGELDRQAKEIIGLAVAVAKSNDYVTALQRRQTKELIAVAVSAVNGCFY